jgi:hypothetical protein
MANEQNLLKGDDIHKFTHEEASKGGKASGEARRRKKSMKESFETLFDMQASDKYKNAFKKQGYDVPDNLTMEQTLVLSMMAKAIAGDARMASLVLDVMGEKQSDRLKRKELELKEKMANDTKNEALEKMDEILRGLYEQANNDEE